MIKKSKGSKRRRVSKDQVRKNAKEGFSSGMSFLTLPKGIEEWRPQKACRVDLDILPYEVSTNDHPDGVKRKTLWWKRGFRVHRGPSGPFICPKSIDKTAACDWCKTFFALRKKNASKEQQRPFNGQLFEAINIKHPKKAKKVAVMCMSFGKFVKPLNDELKQTSEKNLLFFDTNKDGRTIKTRFKDSVYEGKKFLEADRFDFVPRKPMNEEEIMGKVADLDKCLKAPDEKQLKRMFKEVLDGVEAEKRGEGKGKSSSKPQGKKAKGGKKRKRSDEEE